MAGDYVAMNTTAKVIDATDGHAMFEALAGILGSENANAILRHVNPIAFSCGLRAIVCPGAPEDRIGVVIFSTNSGSAVASLAVDDVLGVMR